jgi:DNA-binding MarR family transcriptional regulator
MARRDKIDRMLQEWSWSSYDLALQQMAVSKRISLMARRLEKLATDTLGPLGLDPGEFEVLATLLRSGPEHELSPSALNRWLMISGGGLTKRMTRLEERGLVTRRLDPGDRRSLLVALTADGKDLAERAAMAHSAATAELIDRIGPDAREQLSSLLREMLLSQEDPASSDPGSTAVTKEEVSG